MVTAVPLELTTSTLEAEVSKGLIRVEEGLREAARAEEPLLAEASRHLIDAGGKRFRATLVLLAAQFGDPRGAKALAASLDEVPGGFGKQRLFGVRGLGQHLLDRGEAIDDVGRERGVGELHGDGSDH